ncbi:MAG: YgaP family membrane protein [Microbacteriaceae bacterium]
MTRNVGTVDRAARAVLGVAALVWAFVTGVTSGLGLVLIVVALVLLGTAAVGFCPLYRLLGLSTDSTRRHSAEPVAR